MAISYSFVERTYVETAVFVDEGTRTLHSTFGDTAGESYVVFKLYFLGNFFKENGEVSFFKLVLGEETYILNLGSFLF